MDVNIGLGNENATGMFFHSPYFDGTTMPTTAAGIQSAISAQSSTWKSAGLISEDGPTWTPFGSIDRIRLWDLSVARAIETEKGNMTVPIISTDKNAMETIFGADAVTSQSTGFTVSTENGLQTEDEMFILWGKDGQDNLIWTCAKGIVTEIDQVGMTPTGAIIWQITITGSWVFSKDTQAL